MKCDGNKTSVIRDISVITDDIEKLTADRGKFYLRVTGYSMYPFLTPGRDTAVLSQPENVKIYETAFFKRSNGDVVLHRIVAEHGDFHDFCGDHQYVIEKDIPKTSVIAVMREFYKGDKFISCETVPYKIKAVFWVKTRAFRHFFNRIKIKISRTVKRR